MPLRAYASAQTSEPTATSICDSTADGTRYGVVAGQPAE